MTATPRLLLLALLFAVPTFRAPAQSSVEIPDIFYDRSELPLSVAVLVERMGKFGEEKRAAVEAEIAAKQAEVVAALNREIAAQEKAGNTKGAETIRKQLEVWRLEDEARQKIEAMWSAKRAQQKGSAWRSMVDSESLGRWKKFALPDSVKVTEGEVSIKALLLAAASYPCTSESAVVRCKMRMDSAGARPGLEQAGIGFQVNPKEEGGFLFLFQEPESQGVVYGGFRKSEQKVLESRGTKIPRDSWIEIQIAMARGTIVQFADGKKINEYQHPDLTNPSAILLFGNGTSAHFKDLEILSPTESEVEGILAGRPVQ